MDRRSRSRSEQQRGCRHLHDSHRQTRHGLVLRLMRAALRWRSDGAMTDSYACTASKARCARAEMGQASRSGNDLAVLGSADGEPKT